MCIYLLPWLLWGVSTGPHRRGPTQWGPHTMGPHPMECHPMGPHPRGARTAPTHTILPIRPHPRSRWTLRPPKLTADG